MSTGQAAKICNNMLLAICMIGTSETMNLGMNLGLDPSTLAHVINTSSGSNWACSVCVSFFVCLSRPRYDHQLWLRLAFCLTV